MLLWIFTAGAGVYLLAAGRPAAAPQDAGTEAEAEAVAPATVPPSPPQYGIPPAAVQALAAGARVPPITHTRVTTPPGQHPLLEFMHPALGIVGLGIWIAYVATKFSTFAWVSFGLLLATITAGLTWYTANRRHIAAARAARASEMLETSGAPGTAGVLVTREVRGPEAEAAGAETSGAGASGPGARGAGASGAGVSGAVARRYPPRRILIHGSAAGTTLILAVITLLVSVHS